MSDANLDELCINTIRTLSIDGVQQANSGHPGTPMAMAPVAYCLWQRFLRFDPDDPIWPNRDRFVLSAGHASMLLYSMLHLTGVKAVSKDYETLGSLSVPLEALKQFRQLDSRCPGHPEYRWTSGVETTTGPLGQGVATSVGMAMAGRWMASCFNQPGFDDLIDFDVYALCGDGCMMEGVTNEAASLAGHLKLSKLCWIYDNNKITIEGHTALAFSDDVATRFLGYGWNVVRVGDANDLEMLDRAFRTFHDTTDRPTLMIVDSHIGFGSPNKQDTSGAHGEPLGVEEVKLTKRSGTVGRRTRSSTSPTACGIISGRAWVIAANLCATHGSTAWRSTVRGIRSGPMLSIECSTASFPRGGTGTCRISPRTPRECQAVTPRVRC